MIFGLKGYIYEVNSNAIVIDVRDVFYQCFVAHPEAFHVASEVFVFTYQVTREDDQYLVGFSSLEEKRVFLDLISVSGIGPKTALSALSKTNPTDFYKAIAEKDVRYLKKLPGIGPKAANQIILDIKGQLSETDATGHSLNEDVKAALIGLGFKASQADKAITAVYQPGLADNELLKRALKTLRS